LTTFRPVFIAAVCLAVLLAPSAAAQTQPFSISTYAGNGQLVCSLCFSWPSYLQNFQPLWVKVVDANGALVPDGTPVNWSWNGSGGLQSLQTTTTSGLASNTYVVSPMLGSPTTPFLLSQVCASVGSAQGQSCPGTSSSTTTFYLTQGLANLGSPLVTDSLGRVAGWVPTSITGAAGSTGPSITVQVGSSNGWVSGVEVRLISLQASPSVSCAPPQSGALVGDPGTVLTDSTGTAVCNPILAGTGTGYFFVLLGGVALNTNAPNPSTGGTGAPAGYDSTYTIPLTVSPASPGSISTLLGNNQLGTPGQALPSLLTAVVRDTNGNTLQGQNVNWTCYPANAGTFARNPTISDSNGQVQNGFTLASSASGVVTISAMIANTGLAPATFQETAVQTVVPTYLQKVSGDSPVQTAASGQPFANPLVVQVNLNNLQPASGVTVTFMVNGPASFSGSSTPTTDSSGRASVFLTALSTTSQATVTVTATVGSLPAVTFQLIVIPPGPTNLVFVNAADQKVGSVSPCSLATVTGGGIAPSIQGTVVGASFGPAPTALGGDSVTFVSGGNNIQAPIFSIANVGGIQSLTFQVPCEVTGGTVTAVTVAVGGGSATVNLPINAASPGVYGAVGPDGVTRAVLARPDGSFVSLANPARRGETVTAFVTGLGPTTPPVGTNQIPPRGAVSAANGIVVPGVAGGGATLYAVPQLTPDLVGVYQVSFVIPSNVNSGNNIGFSIGVIPVGATTAQYSNLVYIPVGQ